MKFAAYFLSDSEWQLPDVYGALASTIQIERKNLPHHWTAGSKRHEIMGTIWGQLGHAWELSKLCFKTRRPVVLICGDSHYAALLVARLLNLLWFDVRVYLLNYYVHELGKSRIVRTVLKMLFSSKVALLLQAEDEVGFFRKLNGRMNIKVAAYALPEQAIPSVSPEKIRLGDYVFVGGRSNRDNATLLNAAERLPQIPFVIVASKRSPVTQPLPANITLLEDLPPEEFHHLLAGSRCVVVSIKENSGASGQMVALAAMKFGKLVLYSDLPAISQYFINGKNGFAFRCADSTDLAEKLSRCFPDQALCQDTGRAAQQHVNTYNTRQRYLSDMVDHLTTWIPDLKTN